MPDVPRTMLAWTLDRRPPDRHVSLRLVERPVPAPGPGEVLVRVEACGLCRTDLHLLEGDLPLHRLGVVPGHQVVGTVVRQGPDADRFAPGDRIGIAWLRHTCGRCRWCRAGHENLCPHSRYTGWDDDGGLAGFAVVSEAYAYRLPRGPSAADLAPLLCAGIIGYRALLRARLPPGGRLGILGFGSSAHLTAQLALALGAELVVASRGEGDRALARDLGAAWVGPGDAVPPEPVDAAIVFAPAGELVPVALLSVVPGGTVVLAGIHVSDLPPLDYRRHLFHERDLRSVESNTRRDGEELLRLAQRTHVRPHVSVVPFADADAALGRIAAGSVAGSLVVGQP